MLEYLNGLPPQRGLLCSASCSCSCEVFLKFFFSSSLDLDGTRAGCAYFSFLFTGPDNLQRDLVWDFDLHLGFAELLLPDLDTSIFYIYLPSSPLFDTDTPAGPTQIQLAKLSFGFWFLAAAHEFVVFISVLPYQPKQTRQSDVAQLKHS